MAKLLVFFILSTIGLALATIETNERGGHGLFHGLKDTKGKSSWLEEPKDTVKISRGNVNSLYSNTDSKSQKSSLYLQPEPRGLQYLLDVPDENPLLMNFYRKRDVQSGGDAMKIRKIRQINLQPGNVIPGSRGQAVLYGVPNGGGMPNFGNGQQFPMNNQGIPSGPYQNVGSNQGPYSNSHFGGYQTYGY